MAYRLLLQTKRAFVACSFWWMWGTLAGAWLANRVQMFLLVLVLLSCCVPACSGVDALYLLLRAVVTAVLVAVRPGALRRRAVSSGASCVL